MTDCGCEKAKAELEEYLRNELCSEDAADVREHLASCAGCSDEAHLSVVLTEVVQRACTNNSRGSCDDNVLPISHLGNFSNILVTSLSTRLTRFSGDACSCTCCSASPRHISSPVLAFATSTTRVPMSLSSSQ